VWRRDRASARDAAALLVELPPSERIARAACRRGGRRGAVRRRPRSRGRLISDRASSGTPFHLLPLDEAEVEGHLPRKHEPPPVDRQDGRAGQHATRGHPDDLLPDPAHQDEVPAPDHFHVLERDAPRAVPHRVPGRYAPSGPERNRNPLVSPPCGSTLSAAPTSIAASRPVGLRWRSSARGSAVGSVPRSTASVGPTRR